MCYNGGRNILTAITIPAEAVRKLPIASGFLFCQQFPQADDGRGDHTTGEKIAVVYQVDQLLAEPVQRIANNLAIRPRHAVCHTVGVVDYVMRSWFVILHSSSPPLFLIPNSCTNA